MKDSKTYLGNDHLSKTSRKDSSKGILYRIISTEIRSISNISQRNTSIINKIEKPSQVCIRHSSKMKEEQLPRIEPPYLFIRNGLPFLYTPSERALKRSNAISPFGSSMKGFKIKGRNDFGNMFAVRSDEKLEKPKMHTNYLNMRYKLK
ncbi:hypothetical protein SteCoe_12004 [Stentor coeruleus]|uniref:Uncharacterized protein n=1 Tax=Stentor coeruleus TaxID=5963 RepID=A0A1R2CBY1_9CILI|nr:hypothetical protein SteCoe_12004 [Stentor coeruleus]